MEHGRLMSMEERRSGNAENRRPVSMEDKRSISEDDWRPVSGAHPSAYSRSRDRARTDELSRTDTKHGSSRTPARSSAKVERVSPSTKPSKPAHPRPRADEQHQQVEERRESQPWSDANRPRPPPPHPNTTSDFSSGGGFGTTRRPGGGGGGVLAASPVNSSATSDDNVRVGRLGSDDGTPSTVGWGTSSLAGWGETMAAEAEAEVLGRSQRGGDNRRGGAGGGGKDGGDVEVDPTLREQPERTRLHQMVAALTDLCMYLVGISPLTMVDCPTMLEHLPNDDDDWDEVGDKRPSQGERGRSMRQAEGFGFLSMWWCRSLPSPSHAPFDRSIQGRTGLYDWLGVLLSADPGNFRRHSSPTFPSESLGEPPPVQGGYGTPNVSGDSADSC